MKVGAEGGRKDWKINGKSMVNDGLMMVNNIWLMMVNDIWLVVTGTMEFHDFPFNWE